MELKISPRASASMMSIAVRKEVSVRRLDLRSVRAVHPKENVVFVRDVAHQVEGTDRSQQFLRGKEKRERKRGRKNEERQKGRGRKKKGVCI